MADDTKTLTRSEMTAHIDSVLGNPSNINASLRIDWLNTGLEDIASVRNWRSMKSVETIKLVVGRAQYALDPNIKDITSCVYNHDTSGYPMMYLTPDQFADNFPNPEQTGQGFPQYYTWEADELRVYPFASDATNTISLTVIKWPRRFDTDHDDECPLRRLEMAIVYKAAYYGALSFSMWDRGARFERESLKLAKRRGWTEGEPKTWRPQWGRTPTVSLLHRRGVNIFISPQAV